MKEPIWFGLPLRSGLRIYLRYDDIIHIRENDDKTCVVAYRMSPYITNSEGVVTHTLGISYDDLMIQMTALLAKDTP